MKTGHVVGSSDRLAEKQVGTRLWGLPEQRRELEEQDGAGLGREEEGRGQTWVGLCPLRGLADGEGTELHWRRQDWRCWKGTRWPVGQRQPDRGTLQKGRGLAAGHSRLASERALSGSNAGRQLGSSPSVQSR